MATLRKQIVSIFVSAICVLAQAQSELPLYHAATLYSYGNAVQLYPEGFVLKRGQALTIDGKAETSLPADQDSAKVLLTNIDGASAQETVKIICTRPGDFPKGRRALVLCIGESTTETINPDPKTGSFDDGWNWVSMMKAISLGHGIKISCLGTNTMKDADLQACYTAHGGWSSYTYLNWPCAAKMDPGAPWHFFNSEAMWYALGLQGVTGKDFAKEAWQHDLMVRTPFGKYPVDEHPSLLEFAKSVSGRYGYPVLSGSVQEWAYALAKNPINEFYSLSAAREGTCAFSLDAYLERYRTLDDSGRRLQCASENPAGERVRGKDGKYYRIGTRIVSQALLKKVSVCRPDYVVVNVGINDGDSASSVEATAGSLQSLLSCFPGIPTAHFVMRWPGACFPEAWAPSYLPRQYSVNGNNARVMAIMANLSGRLEGRDDISLLDVWHCQSPVSQHQEKFRDGVLDCSINDVHTGYYGQMSAARQVLGWLYYQLKDRQ
ncbi:MAG: SGNH/GDSL hydrolase family protein [Bacteroidales bacterium]|nr:SGNH/GDSL hydrolase family protein [Bacteroidales bacterium]